MGERKDDPDGSAIALPLERLARLLRAQEHAHGLNPAQWEALRYLARANESARNVTRFAQFHATSKSAASQTLGVLVKKGFVKAQPDPNDPRIKTLNLTARGKRLIQDNPLGGLVDVLEGLQPEQLEHFADVLEVLVKWTLESQASSD